MTTTLIPGSRIRLTANLRNDPAFLSFCHHSITGWLVGLNPSPDGQRCGQAIVVWDSKPTVPAVIHRDNIEME